MSLVMARVHPHTGYDASSCGNIHRVAQNVVLQTISDKVSWKSFLTYSNKSERVYENYP